MSRSRGRTLLTSRSPMWIAPPSSGSSPTSRSSSRSPMSGWRSSTAATSVPSYVRVACSYLTAVNFGSSLDRAHGQAADHALLRDPSGKDDGDAGQHGGGGQLGQEVAPGADVRRHPDRHRRSVHRVELHRVEEL